jgi:hypothetical protein
MPQRTRWAPGLDTRLQSYCRLLAGLGVAATNPRAPIDLILFAIVYLFLARVVFVKVHPLEKKDLLLHKIAAVRRTSSDPSAAHQQPEQDSEQARLVH